MKKRKTALKPQILQERNNVRLVQLNAGNQHVSLIEIVQFSSKKSEVRNHQLLLAVETCSVIAFSSISAEQGTGLAPCLSQQELRWTGLAPHCPCPVSVLLSFQGGDSPGALQLVSAEKRRLSFGFSVNLKECQVTQRTNRLD